MMAHDFSQYEQYKILRAVTFQEFVHNGRYYRVFLQTLIECSFFLTMSYKIGFSFYVCFKMPIFIWLQNAGF